MAWYNASWLYRKKITVQQTQVDADLTDFPAYVDLATPNVLDAARADMRDVLFTSSDGSTKLDHELVKRRFLGGGAWSWFQNPRAIYFSGTNSRTYIGTIDSSGNLQVGQYDHSDGTVVWSQLTAALQTDDHNHPALVVRPSDSRLVAFYTKHNYDTTLRLKVSTNAEDATAWGTEVTSTYSGNITYANPIILPDDSSACYVFSRVFEATGDYRWAYKRTTDYSTFGSEVEFWDPGATQSYTHCVRNGNGRIDFFASDGHPSIEATTSLYHFYAEWVSGSLKWYNSAGTEQTLPMDTTKATLVYDGTTLKGWNHAIAIDGSGYPRVLFQKTVSTTGTYDHRCMHARWNGSSWTTPVEITPFGGYVYAEQPHYTGVACFDGADINKVYLGKQVSSIYEIQEWTTSDSGATWAKARDITSGSASGTQNLRPFSPAGHTGRLACLWVAGTYTTYLNYSMNAYCDPPLATEAYVEIPTVSGSADTDIYVYYGNSSAADQESATAAWNTGFKAVYHLEHLPAKSTLADSTSSGFTGTKKSFSEPTNAVAGGQTFDGADDYISLGTAINMAGWAEATVEALIKHDGTGAANEEHTFFSNWNTSNNVAALMGRIEPNTGATANRLEVFALRQTDTTVGGDCGSTVTPNQINYVALVYDATSLRGHVNSAEAATTFSSSGAALDAGASTTAYIGGTPHDVNDDFGGQIYEIRISNVARSVAWRKATSINLQTPATFYSFGAQETTLAGVAADVVSATGALTTQIPVAVASVSVATAAGALSTGIPLAVSATVQATAAGALATQITFSGAALVQALADGALSTGIPLLADALSQAAASGDLTGGSGLAGNAAAIAAAIGNLTTEISLQGAAVAQALAAGGLTVGAGLSGAAIGQATAAGEIITGIPLVGAAQAYASSDGNITTIISLAGAAVAVNAATGALTVSITMEGQALAQALASGQITALIKLDGAALAQAAATGALTDSVTYTASPSRTRTIPAEYRTRTIPAEYRTRVIAA